MYGSTQFLIHQLSKRKPLVFNNLESGSPSTIHLQGFLELTEAIYQIEKMKNKVCPHLINTAVGFY